MQYTLNAFVKFSILKLQILYLLRTLTYIMYVCSCCGNYKLTKCLDH